MRFNSEIFDGSFFRIRNFWVRIAIEKKTQNSLNPSFPYPTVYSNWKTKNGELWLNFKLYSRLISLEARSDTNEEVSYMVSHNDAIIFKPWETWKNLRLFTLNGAPKDDFGAVGAYRMTRTALGSYHFDCYVRKLCLYVAIAIFKNRKFNFVLEFRTCYFKLCSCYFWTVKFCDDIILGLCLGYWSSGNQSKSVIVTLTGFEALDETPSKDHVRHKRINKI